LSSFLITLAILAGTGALWAWWSLPKRLANQLRLQIRDGKDRADVEDNFRKTIGQLLGGAAVILGAGLAYLQTQETLRAQDEQSLRTLIGQQIAKGFELLGEKDPIKRVGGIYALEGVLNTPEQYHSFHQSVIDGISAFVRISTQGSTADALPADVEAALTVIRRNAEGVTVDLANAHIPTVRLNDGHFVSADLKGANLRRAELLQIDLSGGAVLATTDLSFAKLYGANLSYANLNNAVLTNAELISANLVNATLIEANLSNANLNNADLKDAVLRGAILDNADLSSVLNLGQAQLSEACGTGTKLSAPLTLKACVRP
jgi:uncharacterized protein YjbI with pentapeptide repeats